MNDDARDEVRAGIERWARAVHDGDVDAVVAHRAPDIVMFDVPPPETGVRGIDAYRAVWPAFFEWQHAGATFDIVELDVTASADVAFAWALVRCGTADDFARAPESRLRLTLGLRKHDGEWVVTHEHHSFTHRG